MSMIFIDLIKQIVKKKSLWRSMMNLEAQNYTISGKVLDLGGGADSSKFTYHKFLKRKENTEILNFDLKDEGRGGIDFEKDKLPIEDNSVDTILSFNLLEHIYNYSHSTKEAQRVLKKGGLMIGAVPFLINYHPDPNDYFRYTKDSLEKIFREAGFSEIKIKAIGIGPLAINFNILSPFLPVFLRVIIFPLYYFPDKLILKLRHYMTDRYPLGYFFELKK